MVAEQTIAVLAAHIAPALGYLRRGLGHRRYRVRGRATGTVWACVHPTNRSPQGFSPRRESVCEVVQL
jgi:hypothetical protein